MSETPEQQPGPPQAVQPVQLVQPDPHPVFQPGPHQGFQPGPHQGFQPGLHQGFPPGPHQGFQPGSRAFQPGFPQAPCFYFHNPLNWQPRPVNPFPFHPAFYNAQRFVAPSSAPFEATTPKPCRYFFSKPDGCRYGDSCFFSHDPTVFMTTFNLKNCPNANCKNYCRGRQCKACHEAMADKRQRDYNVVAADAADQAPRIPRQRRGQPVANARVCTAAMTPRNAKQCKGINCQAQTTRRLCKECYDVEQHYTV